MSLFSQNPCAIGIEAVAGSCHFGTFPGLPARQMAADPGLQQLNQLGVHESVFVGNIEADDALRFQAGPEALLQLGAMGLLHDEDDVGPIDQLGAERRLGVAVRSSGGGFDIGALREHLLGGRAAQLVLAADEENVLQRLLAAGAAHGLDHDDVTALHLLDRGLVLGRLGAGGDLEAEQDRDEGEAPHAAVSRAASWLRSMR